MVNVPVAVAFENKLSPEYMTFTSYSSGLIISGSITVGFNAISVKAYLFPFLPLSVMFIVPLATAL